MEQLNQLAEEEDVSVSEIARECVMDGVGLRTGEPVMIPDGGATLVSQVAQIRLREHYVLLVLLVLLGTQYLQLLSGTVQNVAGAALAVIALGAVLQWVRQ
jgi:hypothetical protein